MPFVDGQKPWNDKEDKPKNSFMKELGLILIALIEAAREKSQEIFKDISN